MPNGEMEVTQREEKPHNAQYVVLRYEVLEDCREHHEQKTSQSGSFAKTAAELIDHAKCISP